MSTDGRDHGFKERDTVWRKVGTFYQRLQIVRLEGEEAVLNGNRRARADDLLPAATFAVPDEIQGIAFEASIYDYLVFRTYKSPKLRDMGRRAPAAGVYVEKSVCQNYRRQHFPGHGATRAEVLRLLAALEEQD